LLGLASLSSCVSLKRLAWMLRSKQGGAELPVVLFRTFQCVIARKKHAKSTMALPKNKFSNHQCGLFEY
jgi:hypothetical protein